MPYASCNALDFAVNPGASAFRTGQNQTARDNYMRDASSPRGNVLSPYMAGQPQSNELIWFYESPEINPTIYVLSQDASNPVYVWESESRPIPGQDTFSPMVTTNNRGQDLVSSGTQVEIILPGKTDLETIETTVLAGSLPTWITGTRFASISTVSGLLRQVYTSLQREARSTTRSSISEALSYQNSANITTQYKLLWLRAASMVYHDHEGPTAIPIIKSQFTVDTSTGLITV